MRSRREQALALAAIGFNIFPLPPLSKEPAHGVSWSALMTTNSATINRWFDEEPDMNYAVNPGKDFAIVDLDEKDGKQGVTNFTELNVEQAADDWCLDTFIVRTPSNGRHLYLRVPFAVSNSASKVGSGIDVRGARGYVVGPGCITDERKNERGRLKQYAGSYMIETEREMVEAPQWLLSSMNRHFERDESTQPIIDLDLPANVEQAREFLSTRAPAIEGQGGDEWTYKTCTKLRDLGVSTDTAFELLLSGWNNRCVPPWESSELLKKVKNAFNYGQNAGGNKGDLWDAPGAFSPEEYLAHVQEQREAERTGLAEHLFDAERIMNSKVHREMVIPEWLPATGYTALLARRGTGKTVQMIDMACRIACGDKWHDMPIMEDFASIYVCGEDDIGARDQFRAWVTRYEGRMPERDRFFFMDTTFDLMSRESVEAWAKFFVERLQGRRAVLFLDTWQRATSRGAQNDDLDMQTAVHHVEALSKSFRGPAVVAFHPPKADATIVLGSSVIENASSAIWTLTEEANGRKMQVTRIKGKGQNNYQIFEYCEVSLNEKDDFGRDITGIVPICTGGTASKGSFAEEQMKEATKSAYAEAIRILIWEAEGDSDFAQKRAHAFTIRDTASRLVALAPGHAARDAVCFGGELLEREDAVIRRLEDLFKHGSPIFHFGGGGALLLEQSATKSRFKLVAVKDQAAALAPV